MRGGVVEIGYREKRIEGAWCWDGMLAIGCREKRGSVVLGWNGIVVHI